MKKQTKQLFFALILIASAAAMTACNRGYGCPTDFSLEIEQPSCLE